MSIEGAILAALERMSSRCLDDQGERHEVARAVGDALRAHPDAQLVRRAFEAAPSATGKLIVMRAIGGRLEADVLSAAARLAQCPEVRD